MDGRDFDLLAKSIAGADSRRQFLKRLVIGAGGLLALSGRSRVDAALCRSVGDICMGDGNCCTGICAPKDRTGRRRCACPPDKIEVDGACQCPEGKIDINGVCIVGQGTCPVGADQCTSSATCDGRSDCFCRTTTEGVTRCGGNALGGTCGECSATSQCETLHPSVPGVFCMKGGTGCCNGTAPAGNCVAPCPS